MSRAALLKEAKAYASVCYAASPCRACRIISALVKEIEGVEVDYASGEYARLAQ